MKKTTHPRGWCFAFAACAVLMGVVSASGQDGESAVAFVEAYVATYREAKKDATLGDRLAARWDWEAIAPQIFGGDMPAPGTPARAALTAKIGHMFGVVLADENTRALMSQTRVVQPCSLPVDNERVVVSFIAATTTSGVNNVFLLRRFENTWKITDMANGSSGKIGFVTSVRSGYQMARTSLSPGQFIDEVLKSIEKKN